MPNPHPCWKLPQMWKSLYTSTCNQTHYCPRQSGIRCSGQGNSFILSTSPISLGGGLRGRHDPVQNGSEADGGRQMLQGVVKVAVYGPTDGVSGRQRQAPGLLPLSKRAGTKSCFGQE